MKEINVEQRKENSDLCKSRMQVRGYKLVNIQMLNGFRNNLNEINESVITRKSSMIMCGCVMAINIMLLKNNY